MSSAEGWEVRMSSSRKVPYFFNSITRLSTWETPEGLSIEQVEALPGAELLNAELAQDPHAGQVRASHLLVKHRDSRRPASHKSDKITISKEEAIEILREYQKEINDAGESYASVFSDLAQKHSDCSSYARGGDLGWFGRNQMQKAFEDASFGLEVGQVSDVVSTDSGVHLIMRTG
ncbi:hypothetical protein D9611_005532 [Ephemerocybe angulata]|uniref:Peptidyl-prolyl cis-trans isomerase n=1 Tax=Ephemerocybe angulata TaxID=980116 RepID=A0A8H5BH80_9AGAR|nr:hypothetical protein D9611_005532 [Tulosesus angulatus]